MPARRAIAFIVGTAPEAEARHADRFSFQVGRCHDRTVFGNDRHVGRAIVVTIDDRQRQRRLLLFRRDEFEDADVADIAVAGDQQLKHRA